jgi:endonuclease/exonuclease/phosphatase family metal-dependent hydrolase
VRYAAKLAAVARAIRSAAPGGPDLVALQEVESQQALAALARALEGLGYRHRVFVPQPGVVTGVAFLSRLPVRSVRALPVGTFERTPLRQILEIEVEHRGHRLRVLNNHWKAKSEGAGQTEPARRAAAEVLARRVGRILAEEPEADLLALGDFNQNLEELEPWTRAAGLDDPWVEVPAERRGSAVFRGVWQSPDHMLLSPGLRDRRGFTRPRGAFRVVRGAFLLEARTGFPRRFAAGGVSDHLPLRLSLRVRR